LGVLIAEGVGETVGLTDGVKVAVIEAEGEDVGEGEIVTEGVEEGVSVAEAVITPVSEAVGEHVGLGDGVVEGVWVGVEVVGVGLTCNVCEGVGVKASCAKTWELLGYIMITNKKTKPASNNLRAGS
jgi:hypothetical protein